MENEVKLTQEELIIGGQMLDVKLECLRLAVGVAIGSPDSIVETARKFFEFIIEEEE